MSKHNAFRNGKVHVCREMCTTCIFRPGNLMYLEKGRVEGMIEDATESNTGIICHASLSGDNAICKGFFDKYPTQTLQIAERLGYVEYDEPKELT